MPPIQSGISGDVRTSGGGPPQALGVSPFLLVGSERSGSTMLRLMLDHHGQVSCMYESDFMIALYRRCAGAPLAAYARCLEEDWHFTHSGLRFPDDAATYGQVIESFFRQRGGATGKTIVGATIHEGFRYLPEVLPEARYIHLLRDGRAVAASIVEMGWAGNVYVAARQWRRTVGEVRVLQNRIPPDRWLEVRYEDLLSDVPEKLAEICSFLGVPYSAQMLRYAENSTYDAPDPANAERWRQRLAPREVSLVEMASGDVLEQNGYERLFPAMQPSRLERLALVLDGRIRRTCFRCRRFGAYLLIARKLWRLIGVRRRALEARYHAIKDAHIR